MVTNILRKRVRAAGGSVIRHKRHTLIFVPEPLFAPEMAYDPTFERNWRVACDSDFGFIRISTSMYLDVVENGNRYLLDWILGCFIKD